MELAAFDDLAAAVTTAAGTIKRAAEALAVLDVASALAELACERNFARPDVDGSLEFVIEGGRHPVVEQMLAAEGGTFIANDCDLSPPRPDSEGRIYLLTGPNMAGKSTYLRQNALIAILAQMGLRPRAARRIGVVDRLFSRVGPRTTLRAGAPRSWSRWWRPPRSSTRRARGPRHSRRIGRGTATFDGLSIAWATIEHLHEQSLRALFATHFHELTTLAARLPRLFNATMRVKEWHGEVVFLHEVMAGRPTAATASRLPARGLASFGDRARQGGPGEAQRRTHLAAGSRIFPCSLLHRCLIRPRGTLRARMSWLRWRRCPTLSPAMRSKRCTR
jgi:DNA mismatch repair protein MutS